MVNRKTGKKILSYLMAVILVMTLLPQMSLKALAEEDQVDSDLKKIEEYFKDKTGRDKGYIVFTTKSDIPAELTKYGDLVKFGGENGYTNAFTYMKSKAAELTGRPISEIEVSGNAGLLGGSYAYGKPFSGKTMDSKGEFTRPKGDDYTTPGVMSTEFKIDGKTVNVGIVWFAVEPEDVSDEGKIEFEAQNITWDAIKGANTAPDKITDPIGIVDGYGPRVLKFNSQLYTKTVKIKSELKYVGEGEDPKAMTINTSNQAKVKRPNVGESDAKYKLEVEFTCGSEKKIVEFPLTVPAFEGYKVPIRVIPADANLVITDPYYGNEQIAEKYINKEGELITYTLHPLAKYTKYKYTLSKPGYISKEGGIEVTDSDLPEMKLELSASSDKDALLKSIILNEPEKGSSAIITPMEEFVPEKKEYTLKVGSSVDAIDIEPKVYTEGASYKIKGIKYKSDLATGEEEENGRTRCYIKDSGETVITITVEAPESSVQTEKTAVYKLTVTKSDEVFPLDGMGIEAKYGISDKNNRAVPKEEEFSPKIEGGGLAKEYIAYVNYGVESVKLSPTVYEKVDEANILSIKIDGKTVNLSEFPYEKKLKTGLNSVLMEVVYKKDTTEKTAKYNLSIIKKKKMLVNELKVENGSPRSRDGDWIITSLYNEGSKNINFSLDIDDDVTAQIGDDGKTYKKGNKISLNATGTNSVIDELKLYRDVTENGKTWREQQAFIISFYVTSPDFPTDVVSYLPAPGQFVNELAYCDAMATKAVQGGNIVTLGSYGGSIIYYFKDGIKNDPKNPYGIDFIVYGNAFTNTDGTTALGAAEPASVMVSSDGEHWAELAGSLFYDANTKHGVSVKYENPDVEFKKAADVLWTKNGTERGVLKTNSYHTQPYYPNPSIYGKYNKDTKFANKTYTKENMTVEGWSYFANKPAPRYGYGDTHANRYANDRISNEAVNPYANRHDMVYNGDGMDLAWAVGADGTPTNPAYVDKVYWVKIYNPNMYDGGSIGECSPEIAGVAIAKHKQYGEVGKSSGLSSLKINGKDVTLLSYGNTVNFDAEGATTLEYEAVAEDSESNILVNDTWLKSGTKTQPMLPSNMARIIVQQGEKEPKIYTLKFTNVQTVEKNAELAELSVLPSGEKLKKNQEGDYEYELPAEVFSIKLKAVPMNVEAKVVTGESELSEKGNEWTTPAITLKAGENKELVIEVTSKDATSKKEYKVKLHKKENSVAPPSPSADSIDVKFELLGDSKHYKDEANKGTHAEKVWISRKTVSVPKDSTVKYLTDKELLGAGLDFVTKSQGTYISKIKMPNSSEYLGEFDNGPNSGWMYRYNGKIANEGYATRKLKAGDSIKWFYTDDYKLEKDYEGNWDHVNSSSSKITETDKTTVVDTVISANVEIAATVDAKTGTATVKVSADTVKDKIAEIDKKAEQAKKDGKAVAEKKLTINVKADKSAKAVEAALPKEAFAQMNAKVDSLVIATDVAETKLDRAAIKDLAAKVKADISIKIAKNDVDASVMNKADGNLKTQIANRPMFEISAKNGNENITNISGKVEITVPYQKSASEEEEAVIVYSVSEDGSLVIVPKANLDNGKIELENGQLNTKFVIAYNPKQFADSENHWANKNVKFLAARGILNGKSEASFDPNGQVSRAEFVQILAKLSDEEFAKSGGNTFADVDAGSWYSNAVMWASASGIVTGMGEGKFMPNESISRQDMAVIIERYLKHRGETLKEKNKEANFTDASSVASYAKDAVDKMQKAGIINGASDVKGGVSFNPNSQASRAEAATMIVRYIKM